MRPIRGVKASTFSRIAGAGDGNRTHVRSLDAGQDDHLWAELRNFKRPFRPLAGDNRAMFVSRSRIAQTRKPYPPSQLFGSISKWDILVRARGVNGAFGGAFFLTYATPCRIFRMTQYSISEAARLLGVHRATLHRWISKGVVPEPISERIAGSALRYWTDDGLAKLRDYKAQHYRKKPRHRGKTAE